MSSNVYIGITWRAFVLEYFLKIADDGCFFGLVPRLCSGNNLFLEILDIFC